MRIIQVLTHYPPYVGGIENSVYNLVRRLREAGHEVEIITSLDPPSSKSEGHIYRLPILFKFKGDWGDVPCCPSIFGILRKMEADIIHAHTPTRIFPDFVALSQLFTAKKIPLVLHFRLYQEIPSAFIRALSDLHYKTLGRFTFNRSKIIIVPNTIYKDLLKERFKISCEKIRVIPNAVDDEVFDPSRIRLNETRQKYELEGMGAILFAGRLVSHKGVGYLLRAIELIIKRFEAVKLLIAGNGPLRAYLENLAHQLEIDSHVTFLGYIPNRLMPELLAIADMVVLPSLYECSSNILREALAMERPVVSTKVGDAAQVITNGENGLLVKPGEIDELAEAIIRLLTNEEAAKRMGRAGRKVVQDRYNWNFAVQETLRVYSEALTRG